LKRKPLPAKNQFSAFVELTKPRITFLILVSTALGYYLGNQSEIDITMFIQTMIGTLLLSGGAGAINHFVEKDLDKLMDRTQARPIPAGIISSKNALIFGLCLSIIGTNNINYIREPTYRSIRTNHCTALYFCLHPFKKITWLTQRSVLYQEQCQH